MPMSERTLSVSLIVCARKKVNIAIVLVFCALWSIHVVGQTSGLVAAYSFNEGTGTTVTDLSGNNLTGTIVGATWTTQGKYGNALSFNGTSSYVDLGNPTALQLTGSMTLEAWVKAAASSTNDGQVIAKSNDSSGWQLKTTSDTGVATFGASVTNSSGVRAKRFSTTTPSLNVWYHVAEVYNATAKTLDIYVNGVLNDGSLQGTVPAANLNALVNANIGRRSGGYYFNGVIDEIRIYNRTLSATEIQSDMNTPLGTTAADVQSPAAPANLTANAVSSSVINLSWSASTDNVGVTGYLVERCQGAGCTTFTQIAMPAATSFSDSGLSATTSYSYRIRAIDSAGNLSAYSNIASATTSAATSGDTQPPTAPGNLAAAPVNGNAIQLNWTASSDNVAVSGYSVERCQGAGCTNFAPITAASTGAITQPLKASASNPNYFVDANGIPVALNGSHTWNDLQDWGTNGSPQTLDFNAYANFLSTHGQNFTLLWRTELTNFCGLPTTATNPPNFTATSQPWLRTGPGNASDGQLKFDLTKFDQSYFDRLRARVIALNNAGIYVGAYLFTGEWLNVYRCANDGYPFTGTNNINGVSDGYSGSGISGMGSMTMSAPNSITALQDAYVEKVIDTLNDLPNVLWIISEEATANTIWWEGHQISHIRSYESTKPQQHPIGFGVMSDFNDTTITNSNADWIAPFARISPSSSCGTGTPKCKVNINDSDHSNFGMWNASDQANRNYAWENFMGGNQVTFMDPYLVSYPRENRNNCVSPVNGICSAVDTRWENFRNNLGYIVKYSRKLNLANATPHTSLSSTSYCVAQTPAAGAEYLVYAPNGSAFTVDLSAMPSSRSVSVEWLNPSSGAITTGAPVAAGATRTFTPPFTGDAVLYLVDTAGHAGPVTAQAAVVSATSYMDSNVTAGITYNYRVRATDPSGNMSSYSNSASASVATTGVSDTQPPTAPANLTATAASASSINVNWTAATDNVAVTGYLVERCQGIGCSTFTQAGTATGTTFGDSALLASTSYGYRVRATDAAGNLSPYSNVGSATTTAATTTAGAIAAYGFNEGSGTTTTDASGNAIIGTLQGATWTTAGKYGDALAFDGATSAVDLGNPVALKLTGSMTLEGWVKPTATLSRDGQIISKDTGTDGWQLKTTPDTGVNTFGVAISNGSAHVQRYSKTVPAINTFYHVAGVYNAATQSLDIYVNGVLDDGVLHGTIPATQHNSTADAKVGTRTGGYWFQGTIDELHIYNRALSQAEIQSDMNTAIGAPPADSPPPDTQAPSAPSSLTATTASGTQINLTWTASTDNVGVTGYRVESCQGASCTTFTQIATPATTTFSNTGLTAGTSYNYRVRANDAAGNLSSYSNVASATTTATPVKPAITQQPASKTVTVGQTATFTVVASGTAPFTYQWAKGGTAISNATASSYTTPATTTADNGSLFSVVVTNSAGSATSTSATLTVNAVSATTDVLTYHNDMARTGANTNETTLTPANVTSAAFGKIGNFAVDGKVDAQPLYASAVVVPSNGTHNLLIAATEHDSVYAFDADSGAIIWQKTMLLTGESSSDDRGCGQVSPEIGVTSTPVIDRTRGPNGAIYVIAMSKNGTTYHQRLHALDLATGAELFSGPKDIQATYPGTGDNSDGTNVIFDPKQYKERMGLLLMNGVVYTTWASHCDVAPYTGWIMGHSADTLALSTVLNIVPNGSLGAFWGAGAGIAADPTGNIYLLVGNGDFGPTLNTSGFPTNGDFGNAFLKLSTAGGLAVADYFEMSNQQQENNADTDLGSGGAMVLPNFTDANGITRSLVVGAGKDSNIYVLDRTNLGKFNANTNNVYQQLSGILNGGIWSVPAYFNNRVYYGPVGNFIKEFTISNAKLSTSSTAQTTTSFTYPGTSPSVSANGTSNGIVWAIENSNPAVLHAYDAITLNELYNSNQAAASRDQFGSANKFMTPTIVNGKVFVGTPNSVAVFGPR
jgi:chitodextrinase